MSKKWIFVLKSACLLSKKIKIDGEMKKESHCPKKKKPNGFRRNRLLCMSRISET